MALAAPFLGGLVASGAALGAQPKKGSNFIQDPFKIDILNIEDNFQFEKDKEHHKKHFIDCKSRKDAEKKAQEYGGGEPPEEHHDSYGAHFHPRRKRNGKPEKIPGVHFMFEKRKPFIYKIQPGDCLSKIAEKYKIDMKLIQKWNNIKDVNKIIAGNTLKLYLP